MDPSIWQHLPNELICEIVSYVPQGRHVFRGFKIPKHRLFRWFRTHVFLARYEVASERMVKWFVNNNNPTDVIKQELTKIIDDLGYSKFYGSCEPLNEWILKYASQGWLVPLPEIHIFARAINFLRVVDGSATLHYST